MNNALKYIHTVILLFEPVVILLQPIDILQDRRLLPLKPIIM